MHDGFWTAIKLLYIIAALVALIDKLNRNGMDFVDWYSTVCFSVMALIIAGDTIYLWRQNKVDNLSPTD